jgi:PPOX class probable F420-dependent enzyme
VGLLLRPRDVGRRLSRLDPACSATLIHNVAITTFPESHRDLLDAQFATLATIGGDGFPQLTETWFLHDDGELKLSLNNARLKTRNLVKRPKCSLMILDVQNPYRYLVVRGNAAIEADDDYSFADRFGKKYSADLRVHDQPGEKRVVVTIEPTNIYPVDMSGG